MRAPTRRRDVANGTAGPSAAAMLAALPLLVGCPLSDDYYVEGPSAGAAGAVSSGGDAGAPASAGTPGTSGAAGSGNRSCALPCNAGRACVEGRCEPGWTLMAPAPAGFAPRERAAFVTFGDELFIFGGLGANGELLSSAAIYDVRKNSWKVLAPDPSTPSPRQLAAAVWTGSRILVWGGRGSPGTGLSSRNGAFYDPLAERWTPLPEGSSGRMGAVAGASTTHAFLWGGWTATLTLQDGAERYNINGGRWEPASTDNNPGRLLHPATAFTGSALFVYGGRPDGAGATDKTYRYSLLYNTWSVLPPRPRSRWGSFAAWDGTRFYVWGGRDDDGAMNDGAVYNGSWGSVSTLHAPSPRWAAQAQSGWGFALGPDDVAFFGGLDAQGLYLKDGARYDRSLDTWKPIPAWPSGEDHGWGVAALVGGEVVVWGGRSATGVTATGERWAP